MGYDGKITVLLENATITINDKLALECDRTEVTPDALAQRIVHDIQCKANDTVPQIKTKNGDKMDVDSEWGRLDPRGRRASRCGDARTGRRQTKSTVHRRQGLH